MSFAGFTETEIWMLEMGWEDMTDEHKHDFCVEYQITDKIIQGLEAKLEAEAK